MALRLFYNNLDDDFWYPFNHQSLVDSTKQSSQSLVNGIATDVTETDTEYKLHCDMPGMKMEDIDLSIEKDVLTIKGHREHVYRSEDSMGGRRFERSSGSYSRSIRLPKNADYSNPTATLTNGVLEIIIPKKQEEAPKKVSIKISNNN